MPARGERRRPGASEHERIGVSERYTWVVPSKDGRNYWRSKDCGFISQYCRNQIEKLAWRTYSRQPVLLYLEKTRKETRDRDISTSSGPITSFFINISFGLNLVSDDFQLFIIGCVRFGCVGDIFLYSHNGFTQMFSHDLFLVL